MSKVQIDGNIGQVRLASCLMNASGCWCTEASELKQLDDKSCAAGAVVSKSATLEPRDGNPSPRFQMLDNGSINSMGVPNQGFAFYANLGDTSVKPFIHSIYPKSLHELQVMLARLSKQKGVIMVELNLSCPNLSSADDQTHLFIGDLGLLRQYLSVVRTATQTTCSGERWVIGLKLPALYYSRDWDRLSQILMEHTDVIRFVTTINSVANGLSVNVDTLTTDIHPRDGFGGIGGDYCKPVGLANVAALYRRLKGAITIVGCGGIKSGRDVVEYALCGASAMQVGTHLLRLGPGCFSTILDETRSILHKLGYSSIQDLVGKLQVANPKRLSRL